jgi:hypothetical protein
MLPTDEQVVERIRRWQRYRRPVGAICFLLGVAAVALILYWVHDLRAQSLALLSQLDPSRTPTTQQMQRSFDHAQYNMGFGLGFGLAAGLSAGVWLATSGLLWLLTQNRKDRLLLRCWDGRPAAAAR